MNEDLLLTLIFGSYVPIFVGPILFVAWLVHRRNRQQRAWAASPEGRDHDALMVSGLLAKARIEAFALSSDATPLVRWSIVRRGRGTVWVKEVRRHARLRVRLLPIAGGEVIAEREQSVPEVDLPRLVPGAILSVLYDPRDPRRFYLDTATRDESLIDAVTMRTRAALENQEASARFGRS